MIVSLFMLMLTKVSLSVLLADQKKVKLLLWFHHFCKLLGSTHYSLEQVKL